MYIYWNGEFESSKETAKDIRQTAMEMYTATKKRKANEKEKEQQQDNRISKIQSKSIQCYQNPRARNKKAREGTTNTFSNQASASNASSDGTTTKTDPATATNAEHSYSTTTAADTGIYVFIGESGTQVMINR